MIHILVGHEAAKNLEAAFALDENLQGEILVLRDTLGIGEILSTPEVSHDAIRTGAWQAMVPGFQDIVTDEQNVKVIIQKALENEEPVCFWLSPCVSDVCAYYWLLSYFKPYPEMLHTINIIGLPFLNDKGQLFYPSNFSQVPPKEFKKTKRLLKEVSVSEYELETDEWSKLQQENAWVRTYEGGKKVLSRDVTCYDAVISGVVSATMQKAHKIIMEAMKKIPQTISHFFLEFRLRQLLQQGAFAHNGNADAPLKELEVKLAGIEIEAPVEDGAQE